MDTTNSIKDLDRSDENQYGTSTFYLNYRLKKDETFMLTSIINYNTRNTKSNYLGINYPSDSEGILHTVVILKYEV